jgi:hypothetical protein
MRSEPRGYWTHVFDQAATLLRARPELNGDQAYWLARRLVDQTLQETGSAILSLSPQLSPEALVLAP